MKVVHVIGVLLTFALAELPAGDARAAPSDIRVRLRPLVEHIDLVTDINVVGNNLFICTQPGLLLRKNLASLSVNDEHVFLDLRPRVGSLGARIPALPDLGYPDPGTYDERGLLGFAADPDFASNGRFWVWYTNINEHSANPPNFFQ